MYLIMDDWLGNHRYNAASAQPRLLDFNGERRGPWNCKVWEVVQAEGCARSILPGKFRTAEWYLEGEQCIATRIGFKSLGQTMVGIMVPMIVCGALAQTARPCSGIAAPMFGTPCGQARFGNEGIERGRIIEHLFDIPWGETEGIIPTGEIAFG